MAFRKLLLATAIALLPALLPALPAAAQDAAASGGNGNGVQAQQSAWVSRCSSDARASALECLVEVRVVLPNGQLVAGVTVRVPADTRVPVLMIHIPLGVYLPAGIVLKVDSTEPQTFPLQTCDASGCYAGGQLADDVLGNFLNGKTLSLTFQNLNRQPITVPLGLTGFAAAYLKVE
jgi:invasion protein IalB